MYNKGAVLIGLAVFLALMTSPFWLRSGAGDKASELDVPDEEARHLAEKYSEKMMEAGMRLVQAKMKAVSGMGDIMDGMNQLNMDDIKVAACSGIWPEIRQ